MRGRRAGGATRTRGRSWRSWGSSTATPSPTSSSSARSPPSSPAAPPTSPPPVPSPPQLHYTSDSTPPSPYPSAIACVVKRTKKASLTVGIDGSTYRFHPFMNMWCRDKLKELLPEGIEVRSPTDRGMWTVEGRSWWCRCRWCRRGTGAGRGPPSSPPSPPPRASHRDIGSPAHSSRITPANATLSRSYLYTRSERGQIMNLEHQRRVKILSGFQVVHFVHRALLGAQYVVHSVSANLSAVNVKCGCHPFCGRPRPFEG